MRSEIQRKQVRVNGITLSVLTAGPETGPLLIFLHGFPEQAWTWKPYLEHFASAGYRVLAPDQRGYNLSDKPRSIGDYALSELAQDVVGLIHWAGQAQADIVGHDWGGVVAWTLCHKHAEWIRRAVIINMAHPAVFRAHQFGSFKQFKKSLYTLFFQLPWLPERRLSQDGFARLTNTLVRSSRPGTFDPEILACYRAAWRQRGALTGMINWYRAVFRVGRAPRGSDQPRPRLIQVPLLMIWGARDRFLGREMVEPSLERCAEGHVEWIEEGTHWVHHEFPAQVTGFIREWLGKLGLDG